MSFVGVFGRLLKMAIRRRLCNIQFNDYIPLLMFSLGIIARLNFLFPPSAPLKDA
jgi:hypothetical protein